MSPTGRTHFSEAGPILEPRALYRNSETTARHPPICPDGGRPELDAAFGEGQVGKTRAPMTGKNIWRLCKVYGRIIGYPELKPHDLRHGVAMEVLEQHHDLEQVRALLGHARIDTTQVYTSIRPPQLKRAMSFYEERAAKMLTE